MLSGPVVQGSCRTTPQPLSWANTSNLGAFFQQRNNCMRSQSKPAMGVAEERKLVLGIYLLLATGVGVHKSQSAKRLSS
jgi:hypothetical protein